jgi:hypothetical protein
LVDVSPDDSIWGIGMGPDEALKRQQEWGMNLLGRALEEVRNMLVMDEMVDALERERYLKVQPRAIKASRPPWTKGLKTQLITARI